MARKVVITGLGATTPIGGDVPTLWANALKGVSGAHTLPDEWVETYNLPVKFAAKASTPASEVLSRVEMKRMDPSTQFAVVAAREAWKDSGHRGGRPRSPGRGLRHRHRRRVDPA